MVSQGLHRHPRLIPTPHPLHNKLINKKLHRINQKRPRHATQTCQHSSTPPEKKKTYQTPNPSANTLHPRSAYASFPHSHAPSPPCHAPPRTSPACTRVLITSRGYTLAHVTHPATPPATNTPAAPSPTTPRTASYEEKYHPYPTASRRAVTRKPINSPRGPWARRRLRTTATPRCPVSCCRSLMISVGAEMEAVTRPARVPARKGEGVGRRGRARV